MEFIFEDIDEIIENVLNHLPALDVNRFMTVSKKWYKAARRIKQRRKKITCFQYSSLLSRHQSEQLEDLMNNISIEPKTVLAFVTEKLDKSYVSVPTSRLPRAAKRERLSFHNYIKRMWPASCSYIEIISDGIIATDWNCVNIQEYENSEAASLLMIPKRPDLNIEIKLPNLSQSLFEDLNNSSDDMLLNEDRTSDDYGNYDLETNESSNDAKNILQTLQMYRSRLPGRPNFCWVRDKYTTSIGLIFRGNQNVHTASVVLNIFCKKEISIESELKKFIPFLREKFEGKSEGMVSNFDVSKYNHRMLAFMFSCVARGSQFYRGRLNVESKIFKKLYPGVPLLGLFGYGEVAHGSCY
ncbi:hypothetical protein HELRODRAFT_163274 [Helobdella robusta]|uniref:F-box domain-containing protein n=1 Tax=Helobdella robusta TaxID=6412 RepID=T1ETV1_HELRO|nr:hypothetical protein HELRODRAFT_163274 [Helobdella robusta]ESN96231.1 hypothetical protein HELRODRAFT_163274 [Helobdella robusta]